MLLIIVTGLLFVAWYVWICSDSMGQLLLLDAFKRVLASTREVASTVIAVDAKDERAREFYLRHDFIPLPSHPNRLFDPIKTIEKLFGAEHARERD